MWSRSLSYTLTKSVTMKTKTELLQALPQFTGTEAYHRFNRIFPKTLITDGVLYLAENAECYWLLDILASIQTIKAVKSESFLTASFNKNEKMVRVTDGNKAVLYEQEIASTTFPLD